MINDILLIGRNNEDTSGIRSKLARNRLYSVELADTAQMAIHSLLRHKYHLVVYNLDFLNSDKMTLIRNIKEATKTVPLMFMSRNASQEVLNMVTRLEKTVFLELPYEDKDLYGLADKLMTGRFVSQRYHRRFYTNHPVYVEPIIGGQVFTSRLYNLSRGGGYIEQHTVPIRKGDVIKMSVELGQMDKRYNLNAKVVWTTNEGLWGGTHGAGLEFIKAGDVYRNLLLKI